MAKSKKAAPLVASEPTKSEQDITVSARVLEAQIFQREHIRVVLLCSSKRRFKPYPYAKGSNLAWTIARFRDERLVPHIGANVEFMILRIYDDIANNGKWLVQNVRTPKGNLLYSSFPSDV